MAQTLTNPKDEVRALSQEEILARLRSVKDSMSVNTTNYLNFDGRAGQYLIADGSDDPDVFPKDTQVLLNLFNSQRKMVCWKDGKPVETLVFSLFDLTPDVAELPDHGPYSTDPQKREGWQEQVALMVRNPADGKQYSLTLKSVSALKSFAKLLDTIVEEGLMRDFHLQTPVISMGVESFKAQGHKNYKPAFSIVRWEDNPKEDAKVGTTATSPAMDASSLIEDMSGMKKKK